MVPFVTNSCNNNNVHNGSTGTNAASSEAIIAITTGKCSFNDFQIMAYARSIIYISEETRSSSQKLPACLHKNNKQDSHIHQNRNIRSCSFNYSITLFEKNKARLTAKSQIHLRFQTSARILCVSKRKELRSYSFLFHDFIVINIVM